MKIVLQVFVAISWLVLIIDDVTAVTECVDASSKNLNFESYSHSLYLNGHEFNLKGAAWFGFETTDYTVQGLWKVSYSSLLDFLVSNGFNVMRLPFSVDLINGNYTPGTNINYYKNPQLTGLSSMEVLDFIIEQSAQRGLLILLDMHSLEANGNGQDSLWYDSTHSASLVNQTWVSLLKRYKDSWNIIGADLFNEPYGATWGDGNSATDFQMWATSMGQTLLDVGLQLSPNYPQWLNFVEGIAHGCGSDACFYGENLENVGKSPIIYNPPTKIVYSPHVYGPSSDNQSYFQTSDFPDNMPGIWNDHWGYLYNTSDSNYNSINGSIVIGEWGGHYNDTISNPTDSTVWMNAYINYLTSINANNQIVWCLNPNSFKTGGLLQMDWATPDAQKLSVCLQIQSNPTNITYNNVTNQVCYTVSS